MSASHGIAWHGMASLHCQVDFTAPLRAALLVRRATLSSDGEVRPWDPWDLWDLWSARTTSASCTESGFHITESPQKQTS